MILRSAYVICAFFTLSFAAMAPRDTATPLVTTKVPVNFDSRQRYSVDVSMSSPSNPQNFKFLLTTSTGYNMVAGGSCASCNHVAAYNQSSSSTAVPISQSDTTVRVSQGAATGSFVHEDCRLSAANPLWSYPNQSILVVNQSSSLFTDEISGVLGLGTNGGLQNGFNSTVYANWLRRNPTHSNFTYGMALNRPNDNSTDGGVLHWVKPDMSFVKGDVAFKGMQPLNDTTGYDFHISMDAWNFTSKSTSLTRTSDFPTLLDPYISSTIFPKTDANLLYVNIPGALSASNDSVTTQWTVPCSSTFSVSLVFDNVTITMDESVLVGAQQQNHDCIGTIAGWASDSDDQYLLGSNFLSSAYVIYEITGSADGNVGLANRADVPTSSKTSGAAIAGAVLGSLAFAIALGVVGFLFYRRRKERNHITPWRSEHHIVRPSAPGDRVSLIAESVGLLRPSSVTSPITPYRYSPVSMSTQTVVVPGSDRATTDGESPPPYAITSPVNDAGTMHFNGFAHLRREPHISDGERPPGRPEYIRLSHGRETVLIGPPPADRKRRLRTSQ